MSYISPRGSTTINSSGGGGGGSGVTADDLGVFLTTMSISNTAAQNSAALTQDIIDAQGAQVIIPAETFSFGGGAIGTGAVDITSSEATKVNLKFMPGSKLVVNTSGVNSTNILFFFREGVIAEIDGGEFDGGAIAEIFARTTDVTATPGCEITVRNARIHNFGWTTAQSGTASVSGTIGILLSNGKRMVVDNCQFYNFRSKENGAYSDQPGKSVFIQWQNASSGTQNPCTYSITNCEFDAGAESNECDDFDFLHILQQAPLANAAGLVDNCRFKYHGKARRVLKYQGGGVHKVVNCHMRPTSTWTPATTGLTSITVTAATEASPGVFTAAAHGVPMGTYVKPAGMAGGTWSSINGTEYILVPVTDANSFNLFGPGTNTDTSGLGTYTANSGSVRRTNGQGQALIITSATNANPGVFTTRYGIVTAPHGFTTGEMVRLANLAGGTWTTLNDLDFYVVVLSSTTFSLRAASLLDTSGFGTWSAGTIARVNGCSEEGHAGVDWAGGNDGLLEIENCHMDLSGFRNGVIQSIGVGGTLHTRSCVIIGNRYDANRFIPDSGANEVGQPIGWSTGANDAESSLIDCDIYGWARGCSPAGRNNKIVGNRFIDPRTYWIQAGTASRDGLTLTDNEVITRTPYSLNATTNPGNVDFARCGEIRNWTNLNVSRNKLTQCGNTLHGTRFITFTVNGVTGVAEDNIAPSPCLPISYSSGVAPINNGTATATAGAATLNAMQGKITTESLSTAAGDTPYTLTLTNDRIVANDFVLVSVANGTNNAGIPMVGRITAAAGSVSILIFNRHASAAFNGTLIVSFRVFKA